jgi:hypothetical protein
MGIIILSKEGKNDMAKVALVNLEAGWPTVDVAMRRFSDALITHRRVGGRALVVIHGYGSSGQGGKIKQALMGALASPAIAAQVRDYAGGTQWPYRKREMTAACAELAGYERQIANNEGVTVVILK